MRGNSEAKDWIYSKNTELQEATGKEGEDVGKANLKRGLSSHPKRDGEP